MSIAAVERAPAAAPKITAHAYLISDTQCRFRAMMLLNFQVCRGLAALAVLVFHLGAMSTHDDSLFSFEFGRGIFGVDLFFVLSGFIMGYSTQGNWGDWRRYLVGRALRIYPLYWFCLAIGTITAAVIARALLGNVSTEIGFYIKSIFLLPTLNQYGQFYPALGVGWTLIYEMFFYLCAALLMLTSQEQLTTKFTAVFTIAYVMGHLIPDGAVRVFLTNPIFFEFCIGILLFETWQKRQLSLRLLLLLAIPSAALLWIGYPTESLRGAFFGPAAFVILGIALRLDDAKCAPWAWLLFLGEASYALYLSHPFTLGWAMDWLSGFELSPLARSSLMTAWALAFGCLLCVAVERPARALSRKLIRRWF